jgi:hypothetical protein
MRTTLREDIARTSIGSGRLEKAQGERSYGSQLLLEGASQEAAPAGTARKGFD